MKLFKRFTPFLKTVINLRYSDCCLVKDNRNFIGAIKRGRIFKAINSPENQHNCTSKQFYSNKQGKATMDNLTAILHKPNDLRLEQTPIPEPKEGEVLLRMACVGICGSDVHLWLEGRVADFILKKPVILGHESSGVVAKLGKNVTNLKVGDRVAIEPGIPCRMCSFCKEGKYHLCQDKELRGIPPWDGNLRRYYTHPSDFCYKIPDHMTLEEAAFMEPLSVGVHACRRAGVTLGSVCLITGAGPIGLATLLTVKAMGASKVVITDLVEHRLNVAKQCGADSTLLVKPNQSVTDISKAIIKLVGEKPSITLDCTGNESTVRLGMEATKNGGVLLICGLASAEVKVPLIGAAAREVDVKGAICYCNDYPLALGMVASGKVKVNQLFTHHFDLEQTAKAYEVVKTGKDNPIKVIIHCHKK